MPKTTRRESRETAFSLLFEWSFKEDSLDEIIEMAKFSRDIKVDRFALELANKVVENREKLDAFIERYSQGWKLQRISRTALTALRMSFCEMTAFGDIPVGASINEAVELVKKFGTDEEAVYVNGILGSFERVCKGLSEAPPEVKKQKALTETEVTQVLNEDITQNNHDINNEHHSNDDELQIVEGIVIEVE